MTVGAIVLAAGRSERMGRPKALLPFRGGTFVGAILRTLAEADVAHPRVVLGRDAETIRAEAALADDDVVVHPGWEAGMLSSVRCGIRALPGACGAFLLWPVDHPLVAPSTVRRLVAVHAATGAPIVVPIRGGTRGHPTLFAWALRDELLAAPDAGGARSVVRAHAGAALEVDVDDAGVLADVDSPEEYERWIGPWTGTSR